MPLLGEASVTVPFSVGWLLLVDQRGHGHHRLYRVHGQLVGGRVAAVFPALSVAVACTS